MKQYMLREDSVPVASAPEPARAVPESLPNSAFSANMGARAAGGLDEVMNKRMQRLQRFQENQIPRAEREADVTASGIKAESPDGVKSALGEKMGADFSDIRFHTDASAAQKADDIGARAYTSGRDVYFGQEGFDPAVAAHELVHTAQQGAVESAMPVASAPAGGVQMMPRRLENIGHIISGGARKAGRGISRPFRALGRALKRGGGDAQQAAPASAPAPAPAPVPAPQETSLGAFMPQLTGGAYSGTAMQQRTAALLPEMQQQVTQSSASRSKFDGDRFAFMRSSSPGDSRARYFEMMKSAGRSTNVTVLEAASKHLDSLPDLPEVASYKNMIGYGTNPSHARIEDYQKRAVHMTGTYLSDLQLNPDALDALRKGAEMYRGLGTYSEENKGGMVGGALEAAHRAMNDMLLRSYGADVVPGRAGLGLNAVDDKKVAMVNQAMAAMQPAVLAAVMNPGNMADLNDDHRMLAEMYQQFFANNGMLGG